jgi:hypothetical protein
MAFLLIFDLSKIWSSRTKDSLQVEVKEVADIDDVLVKLKFVIKEEPSFCDIPSNGISDQQTQINNILNIILGLINAMSNSTIVESDDKSVPFYAQGTPPVCPRTFAHCTNKVSLSLWAGTPSALRVGWSASLMENLSGLARFCLRGWAGQFV